MTLITADQLEEIELDARERVALLERALHSVRWNWFGRTIEMRCNRPEGIEALRRRYGAFLSADPPDLVSCAVASDERGPIFFTEPGGAFVHPLTLSNSAAVAFLADAVTTRAFFSIHPVLCSFHAAALRIGDVAAAISAVSTGGKSTTAFACARRGMGLYSDERCVIGDGCVLPFPRAVNLRAGGIELLASELVPDDGGIGDVLRAHRGQDWEAAMLSDVLGDRPLPAPAKLETIFFITGRGDRPRVELLGLEPALQLLLGAAFAGPRPGMDRLAAAAQLVRQARCFGLTLGTPDDTALLVAATTTGVTPIYAVETA